MKNTDVQEKDVGVDSVHDAANQPGAPGLFSWDSPVRYFDQIAHVYALADQQHTTGGRARRVRRARVMELFDKPGGRVLDVACGPGVLAQQMLDEGCDFWGVDGSQRMIEQCHKNFP